MAFTDVERALSTCGYYNSPNFEDAAINATIRALGGWLRVCELQEEEFSKWYRKDFERLYVIYAETGVGQEAGQPLIGYFEQQNRISGHDRPSMVQIASCLPEQVKLERFDKQQAIEKNGRSIPRIEFRKPLKNRKQIKEEARRAFFCQSCSERLGSICQTQLRISHFRRIGWCSCD